MTSTVKVYAHCAADKKVIVQVLGATDSVIVEERELEDGESCEYYIYDDRQVKIKETLKK